MVKMKMLQTITQDVAPESIMDLFQPHNWYLSVAVIILWMVAFMYGWWALSGKEAIPRRLMALTFGVIMLAAFMITFYLSPEMYQLASNNIMHFAGLFLASGLFGIVILPMVLMAALGALMAKRG